MDRLDHVGKYQELFDTWEGVDLTPNEILQRNFYYTAIEDKSNFRLRDRIGVDNIMVESDYPHMDGTWPDTQEVIGDQLVGFSAEEIRKVTWENAARLFRHPVQAELAEDPELY
jgi:hypothetical protein